jgi:LmbE family N-acetylglucosaminyl deacetylase
MATFVFFHAHPDDEAIAHGGTIPALVAAGHRAVVVLATRGERGEVPERMDGYGSLGELRAAEAARAAELLGADLEFLGYADSGDDPAAAAADPACFATADLDEAAGRLAALLAAEGAEVLVTYDETGVTGHPDHVHVHRVGLRAVELLGAQPGARVPRVYESVIPRSQAARLARAARSLAAVDVLAPEPAEVEPPFGVPDGEVTTSVDVRPWLGVKRAAMSAHASQLPPTSWFVALPPDVFADVWGTEHFIDRAAAGAGPGPLERALGTVRGPEDVQTGEGHG